MLPCGADGTDGRRDEGDGSSLEDEQQAMPALFDSFLERLVSSKCPANADS